MISFDEARDIFLKNQWWGKAIGGCCGYLIAGSAGALFGILVGNFFDKALASYLVNPHIPFFKKETDKARALYITHLFKTLGHIAKSDGVVNKEEINYARFIMKQFRLSRKEKLDAKLYFNQGKDKNFDLNQSLHIVNAFFHNKTPLLQLFVETCFQLGVIGEITEQKKSALNLTFKRLGYKPYFKQNSDNFYSNQENYNYKHYQSTEEIFRADKPSDYQLLGVAPESSMAIIKKAYRQKMSQYHPDRLIAKSASHQDVKKATEKTQEIQAAFDRIKASKDKEKSKTIHF